MNQDPKEIVKSIISQLEVLAELAGVKIESQKISAEENTNTKKDNSGATGGLRFLVGESYFDSPKKLPEIIERLREEGRHYSNATISMGLLALVRERVLTRFHETGDKNWKYAIRK